MEKNHKLSLTKESDTPQRLDQFVTEHTEKTRSQIKALINQGLVSVNGTKVKAGYGLHKHDLVEVIIPAPSKIDVIPQKIDLDIVYEDEHLLVINKPSEMVVHPAAGNWEGTLVNAILYHCKDLSGIGGKLRPGIVHRLDKDTTGLLVVAKDDHTHHQLADQIRARQVKRHYLALCHGRIKEGKGRIDGAIGRHPRHRKKMAVVEGGRQAVTHFVVKENLGSYTLIECQLETGRTHQIRVHLASIHHPLVGDQVYGLSRDNLGATRQMLHAHYLSFHHPFEGIMEFQANPPSDFLECVARARKTT